MSEAKAEGGRIENAGKFIFGVEIHQATEKIRNSPRAR
jgi:hypothetical protein